MGGAGTVVVVEAVAVLVVLAATVRVATEVVVRSRLFVLVMVATPLAKLAVTVDVAHTVLVSKLTTGGSVRTDVAWIVVVDANGTRRVLDIVLRGVAGRVVTREV